MKHRVMIAGLGTFILLPFLVGGIHNAWMRYGLSSDASWASVWMTFVFTGIIVAIIIGEIKN
jgi:hypothetical protein